MKPVRFGLTLAALAFTSAAFALPVFVKTFKATYKVPAGSPLDKAACATCHIAGTTKLNPYGTDLKKVMTKGKALSAENLKKIEKLDSDRDGATNIAEIKAGTLPGDPKSKPAKKKK